MARVAQLGEQEFSKLFVASSNLVTGAIFRTVMKCDYCNKKFEALKAMNEDNEFICDKCELIRSGFQIFFWAVFFGTLSAILWF